MGIALGAWPQNQFCTEEGKPNTRRQSHKYRSSYARPHGREPGFPLQGKMNSRWFGSEGFTRVLPSATMERSLSGWDFRCPKSRARAGALGWYETGRWLYS